MRVFLATMAGCLLATLAFGAQARALSQNDRHTCGWGAQIAAEAQQAKLSGVTLYATRKKLQVRKFPKPWMRILTDLPAVSGGVIDEVNRRVAEADAADLAGRGKASR